MGQDEIHVGSTDPLLLGFDIIQGDLETLQLGDERTKLRLRFSIVGGVAVPCRRLRPQARSHCSACLPTRALFMPKGSGKKPLSRALLYFFGCTTSVSAMPLPKGPNRVEFTKLHDDGEFMVTQLARRMRNVIYASAPVCAEDRNGDDDDTPAWRTSTGSAPRDSEAGPQVRRC